MDYRNSYAQFLLEIDLFKISLESIFYASILLSLKLVAWTWNKIEFMLEIKKKKQPPRAVQVGCSCFYFFIYIVAA